MFRKFGTPTCELSPAPCLSKCRNRKGPNGSSFKPSPHDPVLWPRATPLSASAFVIRGIAMQCSSFPFQIPETRRPDTSRIYGPDLSLDQRPRSNPDDLLLGFLRSLHLPTPGDQTPGDFRISATHVLQNGRF
jgi:hypothetical protein